MATKATPADAIECRCRQRAHRGPGLFRRSRADDHSGAYHFERVIAAGFPPTMIDGEFYWDGGIVSNTPMQCVIDDPRFSTLVFQVDLWDASGEVPPDIPSANLRAMEIHSASRLNISLDQYRKMQQLRHALCRFLDRLPENFRNNSEFKFLAQEAHAKVATIVQLKYQAKKYETAGKTFEFSRRGMEEHWQAGYQDTKAALDEPAVLELPHVSEAARIFDVHRGWVG